MFDIMDQAKNAIEAYNSALKVTSANIANMSVPGYKKLGISFQSVFEKVLSQGTAAQENMGGTNPRQFGQGMAISGTSVDFSAGERTDGSLIDLAINGSGLFIVSPDSGNTMLYTRNGNFLIDAYGNLTANGMQVYGLDNSGNLVPISNLSGSRANYQWLADGRMQYSANPTAAIPDYTDTGYRIALTTFPNPSGLTQAQGTAFAESLASGSASAPSPPQEGTVGTITGGKIEQSNVFYLGEIIMANELQRAVSGNLTVIKMASDLISSFISKLG